MSLNSDTLPELVFADEGDPAAARRIRRLAAEGRLRRLHAGIYTSNLDAPLESIVLRHWQAIVGHLLPNGIISHRSALDGKPHEGALSITRGKTRRTLKLPGLTIHVLPGPGPRRDAPANDAPYGVLFMASDPRRYLENLRRGRGWSVRVLPQEAIEASLDRVLMVGGERRLNQLRDQARELAQALGYQAQFKRLDTLVGALLGTQAAGSTFFVMPELVPGTLREGFLRMEALAHPLARAIMTMFVVTEVHPFLDGNGRTARLAMNCVLSAERLSRIIIPTVYREDYLLPLKASSHHREGQPLVAALSRIQRWSAAFDYAQTRSDVRHDLARCNAFEEDLRNHKLVFP